MNKRERHSSINIPPKTLSNISGIIIQNEFEIHSEETTLFRIYCIFVKTASVVSGLWDMIKCIKTVI